MASHDSPAMELYKTATGNWCVQCKQCEWRAIGTQAQCIMAVSFHLRDVHRKREKDIE